MSPPATILITGAAGYIGSHTLLELFQSTPFNVIALDNCSNSIQLEPGALPESLRRVERLTQRKLVAFYDVDLNDVTRLNQIFTTHPDIEAVIHFAALKAVGVSCQQPLVYYRNNVGGTVTLLEVMKQHGVTKMIFSSSATVYGLAQRLPIDESHPTGQGCTNPYGKSKYFNEEILKDLCASDPSWDVTSLRYFNPVGAHESGQIGEDPQDVPNNLMPFITQVAIGRLPVLNVFGNDFDTKDGTGVRDYIHIVDLARGHVVTLNRLLSGNGSGGGERLQGWNVFNLGSGSGYSVLEVSLNPVTLV